jgi:hypothetical protein
MNKQHDVDPQTFRCRRCGRGLLAIQYEECLPAPAKGSGKAAVPRRTLDCINRGWKPTI